jgi:cobalt-zinc-cadmium resistance protein CzcA
MNLKFKKNNSIQLVFFLILFGFSQVLIAQDKVLSQELSLENVLDSAMANSLIINNLNLKIQELEIRKKASFNLGNLDVAYQRGQMQGLATDYTWTVNQKISNPVLQSKKKKEIQTLLNREQTKEILIKKALERDVKSAWYEWQYSMNLIKIYQKQTQLTAKALKKAEKQAELGEIAKSELALLKIRQEQLFYELSKVKIDAIKARKDILSLALIQNEVKLKETDFVILESQNPIQNLPNEDLLVYQEANTLYKKQQVQTAKAKYLPDFSVEYFTQSMDNVGGFDGLKVGVSIPILQNNQSLKRAKIDIQIAQNELDITRQNMLYYYAELLAKRNEYTDFYTKNIKNWNEQSQIIKKSVEKELELGEIDYLRFVQIKQQAFDFELKKLEITDKLNQTIILLDYFN